MRKESESHLITLMFFLGGGLITAPYYFVLEGGSLSITGMIGWLILVGTILLSRTKPLKIFKDNIITLLFLLFVWVNLSWFSSLMVHNLDMLPAFTSNLKTFYLISFVFLGWRMYTLSEKAFWFFCQGIKWVNLLSCFFIWYLFYRTGIWASGDLWVGRGIGREFFSWGTQMSAILVLGLGISWCDFIVSQHTLRKLFELFCMSIFLFSIIISINRSAWMMAIVFVLLFLWQTKANSQRYDMLIRIGTFVLLLTLLYYFVTNISAGIIQSLVNRFFHYQLHQQQGFLDPRFLLWPTVIELIKLSPIIGYGGIGTTYISNINSPHSEYLDTLVRYGLPGFVLLNSIILLHISRSIRLARSLWHTSPHLVYLIILGPFCLSLYVYGIGQYSFRDNVIGGVTYIMIGYMLGMWQQNRKLENIKINSS